MEQTRKPTHPGIAFRDLVLEPIGAEINYTAQRLGVEVDYLHSVIMGNNRLTQDMAMAFGNFSGSTAESWYNMQLKLDEWEKGNE